MTVVPSGRPAQSVGRKPPDESARRPAALVARVKAALAWWQRTRAARANARFGSAGGGVLTGGIAYSALFSVFAGLTIGFTVFMAFLGNRTALRQDVLNTLATSLPGLIDTGDANGLLKPEDLVVSAGLNVAGVIAVVVLLLSATTAMAALRTAVRAMFGASGISGNAVHRVRRGRRDLRSGRGCPGRYAPTRA